MVRIILLFASLFVFFPSAQAQGNTLPRWGVAQDREDVSLSPGETRVFQDKRIEEMVRRHTENNKKIKGVPGYRIRVFSASDQGARSRANSVRGEFLNAFPGIEPYIIYDAPDWKIYVGDFRTRTEALRVYKRVASRYPDAFIINDNIRYPQQ
jgi:hypothetical protein